MKVSGGTRAVILEVSGLLHDMANALEDDPRAELITGQIEIRKAANATPRDLRRVAQYVEKFK